MKKLLLAISLLAVIVLSYALGRHHASGKIGDNGGRRVLYWVDPMHPAYKSDKPGIAPDCGMQLEPVYADEAGTPGIAASASEMPIGTVNIDSAKQQLIGVQVVSVEKGAGVRNLRLLGRVTAEDSRVYRVNAAVQGWVQEILDESVGSAVKKDQRLATFYSPDFVNFENAYLAATQRESNQTKEFARGVQNASDRLRALGMSEEQIKEIGQNRQLPNIISVVSPVDGIIVSRSISHGMRFEGQTEFYQIADLSRVWINAEIFENEARYFRAGAVARVTLPGQSKTLTARVSNILPQVDPATRTLKIRLEADNPGLALRPDMFVDIDLAVSVPSGLTVPADAVVDSGMAKRVFVDRGNGFFEPRAVQTGWSFGDRVQITKGLEKSERVVSSGTFLVDSESRMKMAAAGTHTAPEESSHHEMTGQHSEEVMAGKAADPSCGMQVDMAHAVADGNTASRGGKTYYFCSHDCKRKFEQSGESMAANQHGSGHD
jgi:membrane fusion protein, copper/silver efflux system